MLHLIKFYGAYDPKIWGTPWGAPCDGTGRPFFGGKEAHFTGSHGRGGELFVEDPIPGSIWVYGQKNYHSGHSQKAYVQFTNGMFRALPEENLLTTLQSAPQAPSSDKRKEKLIKILLNEICVAEETVTVPSLSIIMQRNNIDHKELEPYGIAIPTDIKPKEGDSI